MKNKVISSFILLTLISSLLSCNVFATETVELPVESEDVVTIIEPSEEEIKEEQARNNLEAFNLSSFTMSPDLTTVVLTEQLYRAYTIMNNITYHK